MGKQTNKYDKMFNKHKSKAIRNQTDKQNRNTR